MFVYLKVVEEKVGKSEFQSISSCSFFVPFAFIFGMHSLEAQTDTPVPGNSVDTVAIRGIVLVLVDYSYISSSERSIYSPLLTCSIITHEITDQIST